MKNLLTIFSCVLIWINSYAQQEASKNEIGLHLLNYSVYHFYEDFSSTAISNKNRKLFHLLNGITYKRLMGKYSLRSAFFYTAFTNQQYVSFGLLEDKYHEYLLKSGCEVDLTKTKFIPYFAADLALISINYIENAPANPAFNPLFIKGRGIGISPALGLKYNFSSMFSINAECSLEGTYWRFKIYKQGYYASNNFESRLNPLQKLSLNIKF